MKKISLIILVCSMAMLTLNCRKKFDNPPKKADPANTSSITIDSIYKRYNNYYGCGTCSPTVYYKFSGDVNLTCTVTADEVSGNIYKSVYVKDATGALLIKLINSGGLYVGDQIRINLNGVILDDYGKMVQLDSIDTEKRIVKINTGNIVTPTKVTMNQLLALNTYSLSNFQGRLVILDSVEFDIGSKNQLYSDAIFKTSVDRTLINAYGKSVTVRTSGYSNFASNTMPCGKGQLTAVVSQYNSTIQLTLRDVNEVKFASGNCPYIAKNYEDADLTKGGWTTFNVTGNINWTIGTIGGSYASISNYSGGANILCETWLISPSINLSLASNPVFSFRSAYSYTGPAIQTYISTNYISGNPTTATWTLLNPVLSPGSFSWTPSGNIILNSFKTSNVRIGFKYSGTSTAGSTWEIDDVGVIEL